MRASPERVHFWRVSYKNQNHRRFCATDRRNPAGAADRLDRQRLAQSLSARARRCALSSRLMAEDILADLMGSVLIVAPAVFGMIFAYWLFKKVRGSLPFP